jgi:hypothetical protein
VIGRDREQFFHKRAARKQRPRLAERGMARFEVIGRETDRALVRSPAPGLAADGPEAERRRAAISEGARGKPLKRGGILEALRRSPLVGADVVLSRRFEPSRKLDL